MQTDVALHLRDTFVICYYAMRTTLSTWSLCESQQGFPDCILFIFNFRRRSNRLKVVGHFCMYIFSLTKTNFGHQKWMEFQISPANVFVVGANVHSTRSLFSTTFAHNRLINQLCANKRTCRAYCSLVQFRSSVTTVLGNNDTNQLRRKSAEAFAERALSNRNMPSRAAKLDYCTMANQPLTNRPTGNAR